MDHHSASESFMKHLDNEVMKKFLKIFLPGSKFEDALSTVILLYGIKGKIMIAETR